MDIIQTLGEKLSSMFVPSSDVVMEDVVSAQLIPAGSNLVQAQQKMPDGPAGGMNYTPKKGVPTVKSITPTDEHTCSCGMHLSEAVGNSLQLPAPHPTFAPQPYRQLPAPQPQPKNKK